jgi:hypothetical protein
MSGLLSWSVRVKWFTHTTFPFSVTIFGKTHSVFISLINGSKTRSTKMKVIDEWQLFFRLRVYLNVINTFLYERHLDNLVDTFEHCDCKLKLIWGEVD